MDYDFSSLAELYERVLPALNAKEVEFHRLGYSDVKGIFIWNYLIVKKWKKAKGLMLSDIVSDIMNLDCSKFYSDFLKIKEKGSDSFLDI